MANRRFLGLFVLLALVAVPAYASETPYMDDALDSKAYFNEKVAQSELVQEHFPNEAITVVLTNEYFTIFFKDGQITDIMPGRYDDATIVIETSEQTIEAVNRGEMTVADAVTLKEITYDATEHASFKTKMAVKLSKLTSSIVYFFDSLFTQ